jgi:opacity protein-like surface antigen
MTRKLLVPALLLACAVISSAQVFDVGLSAGYSKMNATLIDNPQVTLTNGFRLAIRAAFNTQRFVGYEIGYAFSRTGVDLGAAGGKTGFNMNTVNGGALLYATPEGSRVRPFAAGGVHFSSFSSPGTSVYYGNQPTKFGLNYGGGLKVRLKDPWGFRLDVRQFTNGKPDLFQGAIPPSGWMRQTEVSAGVLFNL